MVRIGKAKRYQKYSGQENVVYINKPTLKTEENWETVGNILKKKIPKSPKISKKQAQGIGIAWIILKMAIIIWFMYVVWNQHNISLEFRFVVGVTAITLLKRITLKRIDDWVIKKTGDVK